MMKGSNGFEKSKIYQQRSKINAESVFKTVVTISSGSYFGELALINNKPRAARVKCLTDCDFAFLTKNEY